MSNSVSLAFLLEYLQYTSSPILVVKYRSTGKYYAAVAGYACTRASYVSMDALLLRIRRYIAIHHLSNELRIL